MEKILLHIYHFYRKRLPALYLTFTAILLLTGWFAMQVKFEEDISKILPNDKKIEKLIEASRKNWAIVYQKPEPQKNVLDSSETNGDSKNGRFKPVSKQFIPDEEEAYTTGTGTR